MSASSCRVMEEQAIKHTLRRKIGATHYLSNLKEIFTPKRKLFHHLLTLMSFQTFLFLKSTEKVCWGP